jgi:organic radical activating enzyme
MIETLSLCNVCYKKIPAFIYAKNGEAWMKKECDVHGHFEALVEKSYQHWSNFYRYGTMGNNNSIIVHIHDKCNMKCSWCYYPGDEKIHNQQFFDHLLHEPYKGFSLMFSGGEPTERPDYHDFVEQAYKRGWMPSTITNMINLADKDFFDKTLNEAWVDEQRNYRFAMSFQHPKNYGKKIAKLKEQALENISREQLKASCVMFSIQDLSELDFIKDFYDRTRHLYSMLRIRTMFHNWQNKSEKTLFLSELHEAFLHKFSEYTPVQSSEVEQSTGYGIYMKTKECRDISLMSAPTVENVDYHLCSRPVYMLNGFDLRCYPVPICQISMEGISKGWKDGFKIKEN